MDQSLEQRIRERAYEIWSNGGCLEGQADQHWLAAEREILVASTTALVREKAPQKKRAPAQRNKTANPLKAAS